MERMKVLFFGAGVLGSLYAAKLHEAGIDVTIVARGSRLADIKKHGIVLEEFKSGKRTSTPVKVLDHMPKEGHFDVCIVLIQKNQLESALPTLATNLHIPTFLFMNNTAQGPKAMIDALGEDRVIMGHVNAGGERSGHVVHYMVAEKMTLGELDGRMSPRLAKIADAFKKAGFPVAISKNIDSWKRYHVAIAVAMAGAIYMAGSCNYQLAKNKVMVKTCWHGMKEGFKALNDLGFPMDPPKLRWAILIPDFIIVPLLQKVLGSDLFDIGGARHCRNAREEMTELSEELFALIEKSAVSTPALMELKRYFDPSVPPAI
ncbi:ketopantoate reductase family protein [Dethiobacter alkaliphilus]|uniref:ketopantoate reductase family protein n=1 Tax=Dethiobacter alkaliphilus TaxID=427926 RepID=UPI002226DBD1|nr:2-dehydropantoate 2-reductase N-terminal domain-containing protein [Dethiobacter alkaliphilus]MCW3488585.1 hypothetical protein [Dethiobacter alkaliphilus]